MSSWNEGYTATKAKFLKANGEPIMTEMPNSAKATKVEATTIPARKGRFIEARLNHEFLVGDEVIFDPKPSVLQSCGLSSLELVLLIPLQKF